MIDDRPDSSLCAHLDNASVRLSANHEQYNNLCSIASLRNGKVKVFRKPFGTHWEKSFSFHCDSRTQFNQNCSIAHVGPGFVTTAIGRGMSVCKTTLLTSSTCCFWIFSFSWVKGHYSYQWIGSSNESKSY